jgi:hypothetical protein
LHRRSTFPFFRLPRPISSTTAYKRDQFFSHTHMWLLNTSLDRQQNVCVVSSTRVNVFDDVNFTIVENKPDHLFWD